MISGEDKERIRNILKNVGASAVGFAKAGKVDTLVNSEYSEWVRDGYAGEMQYLDRHISLRNDTDNVLQNARTVISLAFNYHPKEWRADSLPVVACYAYGEDYHRVIRDLIKKAISELKNTYGGKWRLCVDSAPLSERYWAVKSGIGIRGENGSVIVDGCGTYAFLAELLTTIEISPDNGELRKCDGCGVCMKACPAQALLGNGKIDATRCINYLSIEKRGEFNAREEELLRKGKGYLYGCDTCLRVCPHNRDIPTTQIEAFSLIDEIKKITPEEILGLSEEEFNKKYRRSPLSYAGHKRLLRNARILKSKY